MYAVTTEALSLIAMWLKKQKPVYALLSLSILYVMTWSSAVPLITGAPTRVISSFATLPKLLRVDKEEIAVKSAMMTSHLAWLSWRQVSCDTSRLFWHLSSPSAAHRKEWRHPCSQFSLWSGGWLGVGDGFIKLHWTHWVTLLCTSPDNTVADAVQRSGLARMCLLRGLNGRSPECTEHYNNHYYF